LAGLPIRKGEAAQLTAAQAGHLDEARLALHRLLRVTADPPQGRPRRPADPRGNPAEMRKLLIDDARRNARWPRAETIPALTQGLMADESAMREVMVDLLGHTKGPTASIALAQRALFDLSPRVRERALEELAKRPQEEYLPALLEGFSHPWPTVA